MNIVKTNCPYWAYILGFGWADGYVKSVKENHRFSFSIVEKDGKDLEKIFDATKLNWRKYYAKAAKEGWQNQMSIMLLSKSACADLISLGLQQKHGTHAVCLNQLPVELQHLFWRGLFDGDGHISNRKLKPRAYRISFCSRYDQDWSALIELLNSLGCKIRMEKTIRKNGNKYSKIHIENRVSIYRLLKYLYKDNIEISLGRKRSVVEQFMASISDKERLEWNQ